MNGTRYKGEDFTSKPTKYRLTEDWLEYKKGHIFEEDQKHLVDPQTGMDMLISPVTLSLLLKTGILEEVKERESPMVKLMQKTDRIFNYHLLTKKEVAGRLFETAIQDFIREAMKSDDEASEKIKSLLLSLKK